MMPNAGISLRADGKWRYLKDKDIETAECQRRTANLPRELFNRRYNVEATVFQLCYHTRKKKLKYCGKLRVGHVGLPGFMESLVENGRVELAARQQHGDDCG